MIRKDKVIQKPYPASIKGVVDAARVLEHTIRPRKNITLLQTIKLCFND